MRKLFLRATVVLCLIAVPGPKPTVSADACDNCAFIAAQFMDYMSFEEAYDWYALCMQTWNDCRTWNVE